MQLGRIITDSLLAQRGNLLAWVPLCLSLGIGWYFTIRFEPTWMALGAAGAGAVICMIFARIVPIAAAPLLIALALVASGAVIAKARSDMVSAPVLGFRYYGPIQGRVVGIDRSASDTVRLTLDQVVMDRMSPDRTPHQVRVSVHGDQVIETFQPGDVLILTGHLSPPSGPAEPGGYDFQRHAWFAGLGGVGYTKTPILRLSAAAAPDLTMRIFAARIAISNAVQAALPGEIGAFAAAIITGDRSAMSQRTLLNLRQSNLAHLLAISGLHMGLLTAFVFSTIRYGLVLIPGVGLRWPVKKIAAVVALVAGASYLALSGGNVATERAFIMVAVMLVAVLLGRRALTLRAVAMAAIIVLILQPEALTGPGFQMSFAATTALVAAFGALRHLDLHRIPKWARPVLSVVVSSLIAGLATAPFAAAHFNMVSHYGLIANLLSVPLMGILVMPAAVLAICLAPFGLFGAGLWLMGLGLRWILYVAEAVASQDGAVGYVMSPQTVVLPLLTLGLLFALLWQGRARLGGVAVAMLAFVMWFNAERPALLIADSGAMMGVMGPQGRALSKPTGDSFVAEVWLENDGQPTAQDTAAARGGMSRNGRIVSTTLDGWRILQVSGKTALAEITGCDGADVLVTNMTDDIVRPCLVFDIRRLRATGSIAMAVTQTGDLAISAARQVTGLRPWSGQSADAAALAPIILIRETADQENVVTLDQ